VRALRSRQPLKPKVGWKIDLTLRLSFLPRRTDAKKLNNAKAWTSDEDERLRELVISNVSVIDIAADLGRTVKAVRARAYALRIALGRSRFRVKAKAK
jgi:hypothetical protein